MANDNVKQSLEKCDILAQLHLESIEMFANAGKEMLGKQPLETVEMVFSSILSGVRRLQNKLKQIAEQHNAEWRDSGSANPNRSLVDAARNDAAVQNLIKRASKKTPIRAK